MKIIYDNSYVYDNERKLVERGYGAISVHSIIFNRYYTEEERENNRKNSYNMDSIQWGKYCDTVAKNFGLQFEEIKEKFIDSKYDIHQITDETSSLEHFRSNWDLYFYSNKGWNNEDYMDFFRLSFNENRSVEENLQLLEELILFVEGLEYKNISCTIQYKFIPYEKKINTKYKEICEKVKDKMIDLMGMQGKIKVVCERDGIREYGFFKKGSRKKYYSLDKANLILWEVA